MSAPLPPSSSQQPMPRMTDSMAHQSGPGPSSLKLAALSANSYHLDSPPFTGTAGPLGESVDDLDRLSSSLRQSATTLEDASSSEVSGERTPAPSDRRRTSRERLATGGASSQKQQQQRQRQSEVMEEGLDERDEVYAARNPIDDGDVPRWHLDDPRHQQSSQGSMQSSSREGSSPHVVSHSLSPPPFSSAGQGPFPTSARNASTSTDTPMYHGALYNGGGHADGRQKTSHRREASRPSFTQISDSNSASNDDAASATTADGDADADESSNEAEVDGDETAFMIRGASGPNSKVPTQSQTKEEYKFPRHRLPTRMRNESKIPLVIVACGSFSPPTYLHLRIFEMAKDQVIESGRYELLGGYYSPVSDYYKKEGLAKATHRVRMCELAVEKTSTWLMVDAWESLQDEYQRTAVVLDHFDEEMNGGPNGGVLTSNGSRRKIRVMLLAGGDLIQSMGEPGVWADLDLNHILGKYGCMIVERTGADVWSFLLSHDLLWRYRRNLKIVKQTIFNDISSSKVRLFVRRGQSIKYLLPNSVIHYIERHQLYRLPKELDTEPPDADNQHFEQQQH